MAEREKIDATARMNKETASGINPEDYGGRFINRDGSFNVRRTGVPFAARFSFFHHILSLPLWQFIVVLIVFFLTINALFAFLYYCAGTTQFDGLVSTAGWLAYKELFFFSTQTLTTVGYGRVNPVHDIANFLAAVEATLGFISFAVITSLIYGRFTKPQAFLRFSANAIVGPYRGKQALMFRFVCYKENHTLTDVDVRVNLAMNHMEDGQEWYRFYDLTLERDKVHSLPMNWTVVHVVDEKSPFHNLTEEDVKSRNAEVNVLVRAYDDVYSNTVLQRTSYTCDEIKFGKRFAAMYRESKNGKTTIVEIDKIDRMVE